MAVIQELLSVFLIGAIAVLIFALALVFLSFAFEFAVWVGKQVERWYDKHYPVEK